MEEARAREGCGAARDRKGHSLEHRHPDRELRLPAVARQYVRVLDLLWLGLGIGTAWQLARAGWVA